MARPSPRTQGVDASGKAFQKFGTQQLSYVAPPVKGTTFQGVTERDVGKTFQTLTTALASPFRGKPSTTAFSQQFQSGITGTQRTVSRDVAIKMQDEKLRNMGLPSFDFSNLNLPFFTPADATNGAEPTETACTDCGSDKCQECNAWDVGCELSHMMAGTCTPPAKTETGCTTCDSDKCQECNAWDLGCELTHMANGTCTPPPENLAVNGCECEACKNGTGKCSDKCGKCNEWDLGCEATCSLTPDPNMWLWVKIILAVIGLGVLLYLLKPLFNMITAGRKASSIKSMSQAYGAV